MARPQGKEFAVLVQLRITKDMADDIDDFRRSEDDLPSRSEAIRRLVKLQLEVQQK